MLSDKIDVTTSVVDFVQRYPQGLGEFYGRREQ
jgi:hypothetical protein